MMLEHVFSKWRKNHKERRPGKEISLFVSGHSLARNEKWDQDCLHFQSIGKALLERRSKKERCSDPMCDSHLWKIRHELDMARLKMKSLEAQLQRKRKEELLRYEMSPFFKPFRANSTFIAFFTNMTFNAIKTNSKLIALVAI